MDELQKEIVIYLLQSSRKTVPQIAKALNQAPTKIEYHTQKLVEKGILLVQTRPSKSTIRQYGKKYFINPKLTQNSKKPFLLAIFTIAFTIVGIITLPKDTLFSAVTLIFPSIIATAYAVNKIRQIREAEVKEILAHI